MSHVHVGGRVSTKVSCDIFLVILKTFLKKYTKNPLKVMLFCKIKNVTSKRGAGAGDRVRENINKCHMGEGGGLYNQPNEFH